METDEEVVWNGAPAQQDLLMTESEDDSEVALLQMLDISSDLDDEFVDSDGESEADQQALQMKTRESTEKERRMEEWLQQLCHEVDKLRATSSWLTVGLQQALGAVDNLELCLQQQIQLTEQLQELHQMQLEAAEHEFVNKSMQYQQRLGEMEMQLVHQEQKFLARLAIAYRERDKERAELEAAKERRARELHEESLRAQMAHEEAAQLRRESAEVQSALEAAYRSREAAEGKGKSSKGKYEDDSASKGKGKGKSKYDDEPKGKDKGRGKSKSSGYEASYSYAPSGKGRSSDWSYQVRKGSCGKSQSWGRRWLQQKILLFRRAPPSPRLVRQGDSAFFIICIVCSFFPGSFGVVFSQLCNVFCVGPLRLQALYPVYLPFGVVCHWVPTSNWLPN